MSLNPEQEAAVQHRGGPLLVLAGAGTGKTRVITHRVAALLEEGVPPWRILAVTFTNKAAGEMRERIAELCQGRDDIRELWVGTFHSICARILRRWGTAVGLTSNFSIYDTADQKSLMKQVLRELNIDDKKYPPRALLGHLDRAKNRGLGPGDFKKLGLEQPVLNIATRACTRYEERLRFADAADFGDLLVLAVRLLKEAGQGAPGSQLADLDPVLKLRRRFLHIVVDEFQDTNPVQAELVELLGDRAELCVVGDDDQSIYGWRGADVAQILRFPESHPGCEMIRLEQNYRSTGHILGCADAIIRRNSGRLGKTLWSDLGEGEPVRVLPVQDERDEARWIANEVVAHAEKGGDLEDIAVFYRTHAQSRALEEGLRLAGIRYNVFGGLRFFDRKEIKDLVAYLRLLITPNSDVDLLRVINTPARGIGNTSTTRLSEYASRSGCSLWDALAKAREAGLGTAACRRVRGFRELIEGLREELEYGDLGELASATLERTGYREMLARENSEESEARLENLQEFVGELEEFASEQPGATLADYLEQVSLATTVDASAWTGGAVTLMTVHSAKGLEFNHVYMTGMEERVFPHARSLDDEDYTRMEEERRLAYVAVTRAKRRLTLSWARQRRLFGQTQVSRPSRFVAELPAAHTLRRRGRGSQAQTSRPSETRTSPAWNSDIVYDAGQSAAASAATTAVEPDAVALYIGMQVKHSKFGRGEVLGWKGSGPSCKLLVRFPQAGVKTIVSRFCEPV